MVVLVVGHVGMGLAVRSWTWLRRVRRLVVLEREAVRGHLR